MTMHAKFRSMRYRDGLSISEITRRTRLSRNTVKIWRREPARDAMSYRRPARALQDRCACRVAAACAGDRRQTTPP